MSVEQLYVLKSIKDIAGYLVVSGVTNPNFTNLEFLSNLERILGRTADRFVPTLIEQLEDLRLWGLHINNKINMLSTHTLVFKSCLPSHMCILY